MAETVPCGNSLSATLNFGGDEASFVSTATNVVSDSTEKVLRLAIETWDLEPTALPSNLDEHDVHHFRVLVYNRILSSIGSLTTGHFFVLDE